MLPRDVGRAVFYKPATGPACYKEPEEVSAQGKTGNLWVVSEVYGVRHTSSAHVMVMRT